MYFKKERAIVVGIRRGALSRADMEISLGELQSLIATLRGEIAAVFHQQLQRVSPATFIGKGKMDEIGQAVTRLDADFVAIDDLLSPVQNRNLEAAWGVRVLDRSAIILDIFAMRAHTKEGKLQVELAQLEYLAPRLVGRGEMLSQQAGRIGTRGPGETALELDRRYIRQRIAELRKKLEGVRAHRAIHRMQRQGVPLPVVALVGYTNAGKSTLMNRLARADVFVENTLFATLDPTVRRLRLPSGKVALIADTVGFIRRLPHELVEAFRATFEEVAAADLLVHVIDGSTPQASQQEAVVDRVLDDLELSSKPRLVVLNKSDLLQSGPRRGLKDIMLSAVTGEGVEMLKERIEEALSKLPQLTFWSSPFIESQFKGG